MFRKIVLCSIIAVIMGGTGWTAEPPGLEQLTLSGAIHTALKNNVSIREMENREMKAAESVKSHRADFLAKASASYSYTHLEDSPYQIVPNVGRQTVSDTENYHWDVTVVQPLFKGFSLWARYNIAKADLLIGSLEKEQVRGDVIRDVKTAYYETLLSIRIENVAQDKVKTLESQAKDSQSFYDHGIIPKNDLLKSKIALAAAIQELEKARSDSKIAVSRLNIIMGAPINSNPDLEPVDVKVTENGDLNAMMAEAAKKRPELKIMRQALEKYNDSITLAKSTCYPEIYLVGRYEQNGDTPGATENDFTNDHNASVSLQAKWTFFEWGKTRADISGTRYEIRAFDEKIRGAEDQVKLETKQEYLNLKVGEKNIKTAEDALDQARENFRISKAQYIQHVTTATEVLEAQTYRSRAETDYYKALYGYMIAKARLERAIGRNKVE